MGKRADGYYPTDPYATESLRAFLERMMPRVLTDSWIDPCAGYGALLEGLRITSSLRQAIEVNKTHGRELARRVRSHRIGDGLVLPWSATHVVMNPPFDNEVMTSFVRRALERQDRMSGLVCCLALATWWHSDALRSRGAGLRRPTYILVPDQRVSCDGTGRGDMRAINWLIWMPQGGRTEVVWLPPAAPDEALIREHRRLASQGA
jgi:hypothetical protein